MNNKWEEAFDRSAWYYFVNNEKRIEVKKLGAVFQLTYYFGNWRYVEVISHTDFDNNEKEYASWKFRQLLADRSVDENATYTTVRNV